MRRMGKKGDLLNNVLGVIIAVVGLGLLASGAWKIVSLYANQETTNAQKLVDSITGKIDGLEDGRSNSFVFSGFKSDNGWFLKAWDRDDSYRPDKCYFKSCICICNSPSSDYLTGPYLTAPDPKSKVCQEKGFCRFFDQAEVNLSTSHIVSVATGVATRDDVRTVDDYIAVPPNLMEIQIIKNKDLLNLFSYIPESVGV